MWQFLQRPSLLTLLLIVIAVGCNVQPMPPPVDVAEIESDLDTDFAIQIQSAPTVLVKFGATWCGPCVKLDKELSGLAATLGDDAKIIKVDTDENRELAAMFQVGPIPHMILFKNGKAVDQKVGYHSADEVAQWMGLASNGVAANPTSLGPAAIRNNPFASSN
jgi:thioredoxin 1